MAFAKHKKYPLIFHVGAKIKGFAHLCLITQKQNGRDKKFSNKYRGELLGGWANDLDIKLFKRLPRWKKKLLLKYYH